MKKTRATFRHVIQSAVAEVFKKPGSWLIALLGAFIIFFISIWLTNFKLLQITLASSTFDIGTKLKILLTSFESIQTNFTPLASSLIILLSALVGVNTAMLVHHFGQQTKLERSAGTSLFGIIAGFLGVGCASCGSVIITSLFGIGATAGVLGFFPLAGAEFILLGIAAVGWSIYLLAKKIHSPLACGISWHQRAWNSFKK